MKKRILSLALALALLSAAVPAALADYTEVIPLKYDYVSNFSDGLALVNVGGTRDQNGSLSGGKWGAVDKTGKEVIEPTYQYMGGFYEGYSSIYLDNSGGFIDKTGKIIVQPGKYGNVDWFSDGLAAVYDSNGKAGFIDTTGKEVVAPKYDTIRSFSDGMAAVQVDGLWGYIDKTGEEIVPPAYRYVGSFSEGMAAVQVDGAWGYIDKTGEIAVKPGYVGPGAFSDGLAYVMSNGKYGFIDTTGKEIVAFKYDNMSSFSDGLAIVNVGGQFDANWNFSGGKYGVIDTTGKEVVAPKYDNIRNFSDGMAAVGLTGSKQGWDYEWGFIDKSGKEVIPLSYWSVGNFTDGFANVSDGQLWHLIDATGEKLVSLKDGDSPAGGFSEGLWGRGVRVNTTDWTRKYGYLDIDGNEVVPAIYDSARPFYEGLAAVQLDGKWGFISIDEPEPAEAPNLDTANDWAYDHINGAFAKGFLPVTLQDKYADIITRGEFVTLAMSWLRYETGMTNDELVAEYALPGNIDRIFSDTDDENILAAARLDVTAGITASEDGKPGVFGIDTQFNREQAAIMLLKICVILGEDVSDPPDFGFADINEAQWRPDAINYVAGQEIMRGTSTEEKRFSPARTFTRQESIIVFNQMG